MGQTYALVNPAKKQYMFPHSFGEGYKEAETIGAGMMLKALGLLIAVSSGGGGGDLWCHNYGDGREGDPRHPVSRWHGFWAGDPVYLVGDYDTSAPHCLKYKQGLFEEAMTEYEDISLDVVEVMLAEELYNDDELLAFHSWWVGISGTKHADDVEPPGFDAYDDYDKNEWRNSKANAQKRRKLVPVIEKQMSPATLKKAKAGAYYG